MIGFKRAVEVAIRNLDKIVDENLENHALPEQREMSRRFRNVGLGICGLYDMFVKMGITYGSERSVELTDSIMHAMFRVAVATSNKLAKEKGAFPGYSPKVFDSRIIRAHFSDQEIEILKRHGLRHCSLLSIAPTGSIATMLNISTGCEPAYALSYTRKTESLDGEDTYYNVNINVVNDYRKVHPDGDLPLCFVTAGDIDWHDRIIMQSTLQKHIDTAISSTVNLKGGVTVEDVEKLYLFAWENKLKGVTIFNEDGARKGILSTNKDDNDKKHPEKPANVKELPVIKPIDVPANKVGKERKLMTGCGPLHCHAYFDRDTGRFLELWLNKGSKNGCRCNMEAISRLASLSARLGADIYDIVDQLHSVDTCPSYTGARGAGKKLSKGACCPNSEGYAILEMYEEMQNEIDRGMYMTTYYDEEDLSGHEEVPAETPSEHSEPVETYMQFDNTNFCPRCGAPMIREGCWTCKSCGYGKCE